MENKKPASLGKKVFFWNAAGSFVNAMSSVFLLAVVTRVLGAVQGGIFTIAFALAQQLITVSCFETPTYYVTDAENKIEFSVHFATKIVLYVVSILIATVIACLSYAPYKAAVVILVVAFKGMDSISGLFGGLLQKNERLDIAGKSLAFRVIFSFVVFAITLIAFKNLIISASACFVFSLLWIILYDGHFSRKFMPLKTKWDFKQMFRLILGCLPMFLGTFMLNYIINQPKFVLDGVLDEITQNKFGIIFMPSAVICLLGMFIYRPLLTTLTDVWKNKNYNNFIGRFLKISALIVVLTGVCTVVARFVGLPFLTLIYGTDISGLETHLCLIILGGGMYALANLIYNGIVIMRHQYAMIIAYVVAYGVSLLITKPLVVSLGLMGASVSYLISTSVLAFLMICLFFVFVLLEKKKGENNENP